MESIVTTSRLSKTYGRIKGVENLNLEIPKGSVFGILGPNGSGKTTTLGMLLDVLNPTQGTFAWFGNQASADNLRKIGSLLETPAFYPYLTAVVNLKIIASIKGSGEGNIDEVLKTVGLFDRRHSLYCTYSLGMKQRLAIAAALLSDPPVLILDEPTNGLDPVGISEIREIIIRVAKQGKTVILASHLLDEVQKVCTHFCVLNKGKLVFSGPVSEVSEKEQRVEIEAADPKMLMAAIEEYPHAIKRDTDKEKILLTIPADKLVDLSRFLHQKGVILTHFLAQKKSLEKQFLDILNNLV